MGVNTSLAVMLIVGVKDGVISMTRFFICLGADDAHEFRKNIVAKRHEMPNLIYDCFFCNMLRLLLGFNESAFLSGLFKSHKYVTARFAATIA